LLAITIQNCAESAAFFGSVQKRIISFSASSYSHHSFGVHLVNVCPLFLQDKSVLAFVRLTEAINLGDLTEVPLPVRFLFIVVGPQVIII